MSVYTRWKCALQEEVLLLHFTKFMWEINESEMPDLIRNWTQGLCHWTTSTFCILLCMLHTKQIIFFSYGKTILKCARCILVLYCSWHTIPRYFCGGSMLHLWMSVRLISVCIANASALFISMETVIVIWHPWKSISNFQDCSMKWKLNYRM